MTAAQNRRKTTTAALTGGIAALIAVSLGIGSPAWATIILAVLAVPIVILAALVWTRHA